MHTNTKALEVDAIVAHGPSCVTIASPLDARANGATAPVRECRCVWEVGCGAGRGRNMIDSAGFFLNLFTHRRGTPLMRASVVVAAVAAGDWG